MIYCISIISFSSYFVTLVPFWFPQTEWPQNILFSFPTGSFESCVHYATEAQRMESL